MADRAERVKGANSECTQLRSRTAAISRTGPDLTTMVLDIVTAQLNDGGSAAYRGWVREGEWLPKDQYYERGNRGAGRSLGILGRKIRRVPRGATRRGHRGRLPRLSQRCRRARQATRTPRIPDRSRPARHVNARVGALVRSAPCLICALG